MAMARGTRVYSRYATFHIFMFFSLACLGLKWPESQFTANIFGEFHKILFQFLESEFCTGINMYVT